ncbi:MAG TPA: hypothetical protein VFF73_30295 [Planctomycetota bacterium]|nr:hypothetical protein [Planctomycetota bacterium]
MPSRRKEICLEVRVPASVYEALDAHVSAQRNGRGRKNLSRAVQGILDRALDRGHRELEEVLLRELTAITLRVARQHRLTNLTALALGRALPGPEGGVRKRAVPALSAS